MSHGNQRSVSSSLNVYRMFGDGTLYRMICISDYLHNIQYTLIFCLVRHCLFFLCHHQACLRMFIYIILFLGSFVIFVPNFKLMRYWFLFELKTFFHGFHLPNRCSFYSTLYMHCERPSCVCTSGLLWKPFLVLTFYAFIYVIQNLLDYS